MSIKDNLLKIKHFTLKHQKVANILAFGLIFALVAVFSFGLGRLVFLRAERPSIVFGAFEGIAKNTSIDSNNAATSASTLTKTEMSATKETKPAASETSFVVASKNGKTYHLPTCSGAKNISPENKITFTSVIEAKKAGYTPAKNCKGLE